MDFELASDDDPRRLGVRSWLADHPSPTGRQLAEAGYVVPHWPAPYGMDADPVEQLIIDEELRRAGVSRPSNPIGIGWAAPTILMAGSAAQKERYLWPALSGEEFWCQLFSEPDAGSDLASLTARAERDGDEWVVTGTKIWTSGAHLAKFGILLARTDPDAPKRKGISYFVCPMDTPGISMSPIIDMTGAHSFNQVFFDEVRLPADCLVGDVNDGWRLAKATLANERVSLSTGGVLWGSGPSAQDLVDLVRGWRDGSGSGEGSESGDGSGSGDGSRSGDGSGSGDGGGLGDPLMRQRLGDPLLRQRLANIWIEGEVLRLIRLRTLSARLAGRAPGPEASVQKLLADEHGQRVMELAKDMVGASGMLAGSGPAGHLPGSRRGGATEIRFADDLVPGVERVWHYGFLFSPALTIGGGTWAVQRNIIGEWVLGLPREPGA